jgi:hypothetical protein
MPRRPGHYDILDKRSSADEIAPSEDEEEEKKLKG